MEDPAFPEALMREARLASPELEFTQLDNGLRIVSSDRQVSRRSVGAVSAKNRIFRLSHITCEYLTRNFVTLYLRLR